MLTFLSFAAGLTYAFIAYSDLRERKIANELVVILAVFAVFKLLLAGDAVTAAYTAAAALAVGVVTLVLFSRGIMGGGDVKLIAASALFVGYQDLPGFLAVMALTGGVLALLCLAEQASARLFGYSTGLLAVGPAGGLAAETAVRPSVPYGVAIAAAGIWFALHQAPLGY